jgi:hypothetical protein
MRSQRSCVAIEQGWLDASTIDLSASPGRAAELAQIRTGILKAARSCRHDFGPMPSYALALPAN